MTDADALRLREQGLLYREIAEILGIPTAVVWRACNRERARQATHDSNKRYLRRSRIAIVDLSPERRRRFYLEGV